MIIIILLFFITFYSNKIRYLLFFFIGVTYTLYIFHGDKTFYDKNQYYYKSYENIKILVLSKRSNKSFNAKIIDNKVPFRKIIINDYLRRDWMPGQLWEVNLKLKPAIGIVNNIGFNLENWSLANSVDAYGSLGKYRKLISYNSSNITKIISWWQKLRTNTKDRIYKVADDYYAGATLICALVLGDTTNISSKNIEIFRKLGLIHLISISGLHIGMVAYFITCVCYFLVKLLIFFRVNLVLPNNLKIYIVILSCFIAFIYSLFAGFSVSAQRSIFMLIILTIVIATKSYTNIWSIFKVALFSVLVYNPKSILVQGFWLSFSFVAILIYSSYGFINNTLISFFRAQLALVLLSIIIIGYFFGNFPIISPLVNLIAIPWFSLILTPLSLICIILPWDFVLKILILLSQITLKILSFLSIYSYYLPISKVPIIFLILTIIAILILILPIGTGLRIWSISIIIGFIIFPKDKIRNKDFKANVFDVGNGISILIQTSDHNILYDTGKLIVVQNIISNLNYLGVKSLDMLILSNNNASNDGGYNIIDNNIKIRKIFAGQPFRYIENDILYCKDELTWQFDGVYFEFLTPNTFSKTKKNNDAGCVLRIISGNKAIIITGNLSTRGQKDLINKYGNLLYSQVLILSKGSNKNILSDILLDYINPEYVVLSLGLNNYDKSLDNIVKKKISIFRTDLQGQIEIYISENDIKINKVKKFKKFWQQK